MDQVDSAVSIPKRLNLGCGTRPLENWINIDCAAHKAVDLVFDLDSCATQRLPYEDGTIDEIRGAHFIEHICDTLSLMQELHRVSKPNALARFYTPFGSSDDAFEDPTHARQYFVNSWGYFAQPTYWRADYGYRGDWQPERVRLTVRKRRHEGQSDSEVWEIIRSARNVVVEMTAILRCVKPVRPATQELMVQPRCEIERRDL